MATRSRLIGLAICAALIATATEAAPYVYPLNYTRIQGQGTATGTFTFDDSVIPNGAQSTPCDLTALTSFSLTVSGLPTSPSSTTFTKANLADWVVDRRNAGKFRDINFFMYSCALDLTNGDGYSIQGINYFTLAIYQGQASGTNDPIAVFQLSEGSIPALSHWGLAALGALLAAAGALALRRLT